MYSLTQLKEQCSERKAKPLAAKINYFRLSFGLNQSNEKRDLIKQIIALNKEMPEVEASSFRHPLWFSRIFSEQSLRWFSCLNVQQSQAEGCVFDI